VTAPVFLVDAAAACGDEVVLTGQEGHHAADVRRLRAGERVDVTDGLGLRLRCRVRTAGRSELVLEVQERVVEPAADPRLVVVQALVKHEAAEQAVTTMTEVGIDEIVPWSARHSVVTWPGERAARGLRRWRTAAEQAAKQARRAWLPLVTEPAGTPEVLDRVAAADLAVMLDADAASAPLRDLPVPESGTIVLVVGPEGGISPDERDLLTAAGAVPARLGPTVLRSATAGTVAAAVLLSGTARWTGASRPATTTAAPTGAVG
jgi:16S rRNA (uracil1498-N3)-methyltransferase